MRSRTRSLACEMLESTRASHHRFTEQSGVSCAMVLTAYSALSPVNGSFATVASRSPPASLTPASRGQDHTILPSALASLVLRHHPRPSHPAPTFVTIATRPSYRDRTRESVQLICPTAQAKFLRGGTDDPNHLKSAYEIRFYAHAISCAFDGTTAACFGKSNMEVDGCPALGRCSLDSGHYQ